MPVVQFSPGITWPDQTSLSGLKWASVALFENTNSWEILGNEFCSKRPINFHVCILFKNKNLKVGKYCL